MSDPLITSSLDEQDEIDLQRLFALEHEHNKILGRPLVMRFLNVNESRARRLIGLANATRHGVKLGNGASTVQLAPGHAGPQLQVVRGGSVATAETGTHQVGAELATWTGGELSTSDPLLASGGGALAPVGPTPATEASVRSAEQGPATPVGGQPSTTVRQVRFGWQRWVAAPFIVLAGLVSAAGTVLVGGDQLFGRHVLPAPWWTVATVAGIAAALLWLVGRAVWASAPTREVVVRQLTPAARAFYGAFAVGLGLSGDTSFRLFHYKFGLPLAESLAFFAGLEILLLAAGLGMRHSMETTGRPGPTRYLTWGTCAMAAAGALTLSGWPVGPLRVLVGPVLAVVALHYALGVELRDRTRPGSQQVRRDAVTALGRMARELQERLISRFGLADDDRTALQRTRERAADRYGRLIASPATSRFHRWRMRSARRKANLHDPQQVARVFAAVRHERSDDELREFDMPPMWSEVRNQLIGRAKHR